MNRLPWLLILLIGLWGWQRYRHDPAPRARPVAIAPEPESRAESIDPRSFSCDGRQYCSQMTSCEEATYFLEHCPNVKMDGDHNGVPCERQWCGTR